MTGNAPINLRTTVLNYAILNEQVSAVTSRGSGFLRPDHDFFWKLFMAGVSGTDVVPPG